jgi:hypothetical protein
MLPRAQARATAQPVLKAAEAQPDRHLIARIEDTMGGSVVNK